MEGNFIQEARALKAEADKKLSSGGGFFGKIFGNKEDKYESARDLYEKAANAFKMADEYNEAGQCYEKCAELEAKLDGIPGHFQQDALTCYKQGNPEKYNSMIDETIMSFCRDGRISQAARMRKDQAEQAELNYEYETAAKCFYESGKLFLKDNLPSLANQMLLKAADLKCTLAHPKWEEIIKIYESVIKAYLSKDILKSSAKNLIVKCCLAYLAFDDSVGALNKFKAWALEDPTLRPSREGELLSCLIEAKLENDSDKFLEAVQEYTKITPFLKVENALLATVTDSLSGVESAPSAPSNNKEGDLDMGGDDDDFLK